jgi:hypothetical protein
MLHAEQTQALVYLVRILELPSLTGTYIAPDKKISNTPTFFFGDIDKLDTPKIGITRMYTSIARPTDDCGTDIALTFFVP